MERHIRSEALEDPLAESLDFRWEIVLARDQEGGDLEPDLGLVLEVHERIEHRSELGRAQPLVELLGEALQVDVCRVHVPEELGAGLLADITGADRNRLNPPLAASLGDINGVLEEDDRVIVSERDRPAPALDRGLGNRLWASEVL